MKLGHTNLPMRKSCVQFGDLSNWNAPSASISERYAIGSNAGFWDEDRTVSACHTFCLSRKT